MAESNLPIELTEILSFINNTHFDLISCGLAAIHLLDKSILYLSTNPIRLKDSRAIASSLLQLSNERILAYNYKDVPVYWRRMYTDASIIRVMTILAELSLVKEDVGEDIILEAIKSLDMVLIVAGAPGQERDTIVFKLIALLQKNLADLSDIKPPSAKRSKSTTTSSQSTIPPIITHPILRLSTTPSISEFHQLIEKPFIITGGASQWPAIKSWSSFSYLEKIAGKGRVVPVEVGGNYTAGDWSQKIVPFSTFIASLSGTQEKLYLAQHDLFRQLPQLEQDIFIPDLVYCRPERLLEEQFKTPNTDSGMVVNAWLGPEGTISPAHTDPYFNCYTQVVGEKWIWVAPPSVSSSLYTFGSSASSPPLSSNESESDQEEEEDSSTSHYMSNTSRIDVSLAPSAPSLKKYPKFLEEVVPVAKQAILKPGDILFMPPGWWHSMKSLDVSFSVSIWF